MFGAFVFSGKSVFTVRESSQVPRNQNLRFLLNTCCSFYVFLVLAFCFKVKDDLIESEAFVVSGKSVLTVRRGR